MHRAWASVWVVAAGCIAAGCGSDAGAPVVFTEGERAVIATLSPVPAPPPSPSNAWADDADAAALGHALFFDTRLSGNGEVACATCHKPERWFTDGLKLAKGVGEAPRHTPTVLGAAHGTWQFWDGRADSLWAQALGPLENAKEHGTDRLAVLHVVAAHHRAAWEAAFGPLPDLSDTARFPAHARPATDDASAAAAWSGMAEADRALVNGLFAKVGKAVAAYERALRGGEAPFDRFASALAAGDAAGGGHLSPSAQRGLRLFLDPGVGCVFCHAGPRFTTGVFLNIGLEQPTWQPGVDRGRYDGAAAVLLDPFNCRGPFSDAKEGECDHLVFLNPSDSSGVAAFKVPTLRDVARTAPYMHAGQYPTIGAVIDHYDRVEDHFSPVGLREPFMRDLGLSAQDKADLAAFLASLSSDPPSGPLAAAP